MCPYYRYFCVLLYLNIQFLFFYYLYDYMTYMLYSPRIHWLCGKSSHDYKMTYITDKSLRAFVRIV